MHASIFLQIAALVQNSNCRLSSVRLTACTWMAIRASMVPLIAVPSRQEIQACLCLRIM